MQQYISELLQICKSHSVNWEQEYIDKIPDIIENTFAEFLAKWFPQFHKLTSTQQLLESYRFQSYYGVTDQDDGTKYRRHGKTTYGLLKSIYLCFKRPGARCLYISTNFPQMQKYKGQLQYLLLSSKLCNDPYIYVNNNIIYPYFLNCSLNDIRNTNIMHRLEFYNNSVMRFMYYNGDYVGHGKIRGEELYYYTVLDEGTSLTITNTIYNLDADIEKPLIYYPEILSGAETDIEIIERE